MLLRLSLALMVAFLVACAPAPAEASPAMIVEVQAAPTTCASEGYTGLKLDWCRNICEKDYTGTQLKTWIRRWMGRYHDLPYCLRD